VTRNAYIDFCLALQAMRRYAEGVRTPLAWAMGVAASLYPHQLANVHRVLTDVRVRHLLADEVGLGKTVEALMVLNVLRIVRPDLRVLIIVPDRLVPQWRDEILTRAHTAPVGEEGEGEGEQYIRLAWESQLRQTDSEGRPRFSLSDISAERFDVLVVDELHRLRNDLQDRIVRASADFEHLLVLTATPAFQRVERHAQLFALLEPERAANARWRVAISEAGIRENLSVSDDLSQWPEWATASVVADIVGRDRTVAEPLEDELLAATAMANCAYRRVIRTRRIDYGDVLPRRKHRALFVEPIGAEAERQSLMWEYFGFLGDLTRRFDPVLLAKRVVLSPPSLEQRVDFLRRMGHERNGILERVKPLVHRNQGDSRADALVDLLAEVWARDPSERVLVAAQDNLTVDYLFDLVQARLPIIGPLNGRLPLVAARLRQGMTTEAVEDLGAFGNETNENLEAFQRGNAQVLFAPEAAQVGLNLQCARVLVLYSVPWRPEEVEQWIGRLDRIGNVAAFANDGNAKTIDVYTIAQRGLIDERVVRTLQHFHVFERSVNLDGRHLGEVAEMIEVAALRTEGVSWREIEDATETMAAEDEVQELDSPLRGYLPWTVRYATRLNQYLEKLPPAPPVLLELPEHRQAGPRSWDRAFEGMLKLLKQAGEYHIRWNEDPSGLRFRTLWYRFGDLQTYGHRDVLSKVIFSFGADPAHERSPRHAFAFITKRGDIGTPPHRRVTMTLDDSEVPRPLRFASFGDALHDEIVQGWMPGGEHVASVEVSFFDDHAFWQHGDPVIYLIRASILDPAAGLSGPEFVRRTIEDVGQAATRTLGERLRDVVRPLERACRCALEADIRWLRSELAATLILEGRKRVGQQWVNGDAEEVRALLNPMAHGGNRLPHAASLRLSPDEMSEVISEFKRMRAEGSAAARVTWSHRFPEFERALRSRLYVVSEEGRDALAVAEEQLRNAEGKVRTATESGVRAQISRAENNRDTAADNVEMTKVLWELRCRWLGESGAQVQAIRPREHLTAVLRARRCH
jgi:ATP-dependent helicase HepA